jgi:hypothetical protein
MYPGMEAMMVEAVLKAVSNSLTMLGLTSRMATSSIMGWMFLPGIIVH